MMLTVVAILAILGDALSLFGLCVLIYGKMRISATLRFEGRRARITGAIFMLPYVLRVVFRSGLLGAAFWTLCSLAGGIGYALQTRPKQLPRS